MFDKEYYLRKYQEENDPKNKEQLDNRAKEYYQEYEERKKLCKQADKQYCKEHYKEVYKKASAKRRSLGFIPLNKHYEGAEAHHISENFVIYIPEEIHKSIRHSMWSWKGMEEINKLAIGYI